MGLVGAVFFLHDCQSIRLFIPPPTPPTPKNYQFTCLGDCGLGKTTTRLTEVFTFQLVGLALCGHTDVCGDKERSRRVRPVEEMLSHFNTHFPRKGKVGFFKYLPSVKQPRSNHRNFFLFFSVFLDYLYFTN